MIFHGIMTIYGMLVLIYDEQKLEFKRCYQDVIILTSITFWAIIGNIFYNGEAGNYKNFFNWFFVVRDPFYLLPESISPYIMPFINIALFFAAEMLLYSVIWFFKKVKKGKCNVLFFQSVLPLDIRCYVRDF